MTCATMTHDEWVTRGRELFGEDKRTWRFRCVRCGNVQSHELVKERNPQIGDTSSWIYYACEGRHTPNVGCDWSLGGLFRIHKLEVIVGDLRTPCFEFAT